MYRTLKCIIYRLIVLRTHELQCLEPPFASEYLFGTREFCAPDATERDRTFKQNAMMQYTHKTIQVNYIQLFRRSSVAIRIDERAVSFSFLDKVKNKKIQT